MEEYMKMLQKAWCQYIVCVLSRDGGSRFPNMGKMSRAMGNGIEQLHAFNGGMQIQAPNFAQFMPPTAVNPNGLPVAQVPQVHVKPKDDPRLVRLETKVHSMEQGIQTLLDRVPPA